MAKKVSTQLERVEQEISNKGLPGKAAQIREELENPENEETARRLEHMLKYVEKEQAEEEFQNFYSKKRRYKKYRNLSPKEIAEMRDNFHNSRSK